MNTLLSFLMLSALAGPVQIDGKDAGALSLKGGAKLAGGALALNGGSASLSAAKQKALDGQIKGKSFALVVNLKDSGAGDALALSVGPLKLQKKAGTWQATAGTGSISLGRGSMKLVLTADGGSLRAYKNGKAAGFAAYSASAYSPLVIGAPKGSKTPFKGSILELNVIPRSLMPGTAMSMSESSEAVDTTATIQAQLVNFTPVPAPNDVLPYKHALITQEYKVVSVVKGNLEGVTPGAIIRVARWGIIGGKKTEVANQKKGDTVTLTVGMFDKYPEVATEFTVDKLPENFDAPYLYDPVRPGN